MFGRRLEAIGEDLKSSDSMGLKIAKTQFIATCVGGAFAGLSGVYLTLSYVPYWTDGMTAGRGWISPSPGYFWRMEAIPNCFWCVVVWILRSTWSQVADLWI